MSGHRSRTSPLVFTLFVLAGCSSAPVETTPPSRPQAPQAQKGAELLVLQDVELPRQSGERPRWLRISAPLDGDALPVILYSHDVGEDIGGATELMDAWAQGRYVVIGVSHLDDHEFSAPAQVARRVEDLRAVITGFDDLMRQNPLLAGSIDAGRIGVAGEGVAALAALAMAGLKLTGIEQPTPGSSIKAVWAIHPSSSTNLRANESHWNSLNTPIAVSIRERGLLNGWRIDDIHETNAQLYALTSTAPLDTQTFAELSTWFFQSYVNDSDSARKKLNDASKTLPADIARLETL